MHQRSVLLEMIKEHLAKMWSAKMSMMPLQASGIYCLFLSNSFSPGYSMSFLDSKYVFRTSLYDSTEIVKKVGVTI